MQNYTREQLMQIMQALKKEISSNPDNAAAVHDLGVCYMHLTDWDKAEEQFKRALEINSKDTVVSCNYFLGTIAAEKGDMDTAIEYWKTVVKNDERNVMTHYSLGKAYANKGLLDAAIMHLRKADRYHKKGELQLLKRTLAQVYAMKGEYGVALKEWEKAAKSNPKDPQPPYNMSIIYTQMGNLEEALKYGHKALEMDEDNVAVYYHIGLIHLRAGNYDEAIKNLEKAVEMTPDDIQMQINLGEAYARRGLLDKAIKQWEAVLEKDPSNTHASYNIGVIYYENGFPDKAVEHWANTIKIDENYLPVYISMGSAYVTLKDYDNALKAWRKAKEISPDNVGMIDNLAELHIYRGELDDSLKECEEALAITSENPRTYLLKGVAFAKLGKWQECADAWKQAKVIEEQVFEFARLVFVELIGVEGVKEVQAHVEDADSKALCGEIIEVLEQEETEALVQELAPKKPSEAEKGLLSSLLKFLRK